MSTVSLSGTVAHVPIVCIALPRTSASSEKQGPKEFIGMLDRFSRELGFPLWDLPRFDFRFHDRETEHCVQNLWTSKHSLRRALIRGCKATSMKREIIKRCTQGTPSFGG